jgi:hypothetical protein
MSAIKQAKPMIAKLFKHFLRRHEFVPRGWRKYAATEGGRLSERILLLIDIWVSQAVRHFLDHFHHALDASTHASEMIVRVIIIF